MYRSIRYFEDLYDNNHPYPVGTKFPRKGLEVSEERIEELLSKGNPHGVPLIEEVKGE